MCADVCVRVCTRPHTASQLGGPHYCSNKPWHKVKRLGIEFNTAAAAKRAESYNFGTVGEPAIVHHPGLICLSRRQRRGGVGKKYLALKRIDGNDQEEEGGG